MLKQALRISTMCYVNTGWHFMLLLFVQNARQFHSASAQMKNADEWTPHILVWKISPSFS